LYIVFNLKKSRMLLQQVGTKSDVWSLGCILYNLVYNHTPFDSFRNPLHKLQAITDQKHEIVFPNTNIPHVVDVLKVLPVYLFSACH
jgi:serine/threonine protein kinase